MASRISATIFVSGRGMSTLLKRWEQRVTEEAYLFNPAFCGALIAEFVREFRNAKDDECPFMMPFCALPISLHPKTRSLLPNTTLTSMYTWLERNSESLIGYQARAASFRPVLQEAVQFALNRSALTISDAGHFSLGPVRVAFTARFQQELTNDARDCVSATKLLGRWFAKAGTTSTILAAWGIRP
jgi:hypothetical protein